MARLTVLPTDEQRKRVSMYSGLGLTQEQIGYLIGRSVEWLAKHCRDELDRGKAEVIAKVAGALIRNAMAGRTADAIFFLKTQAGWRETVHNEHSGPNGGAMKMVHRIELVPVESDHGDAA